ncbi:DoxX family protein [Myroides marinus]|uniref:DoxX family protein n=1 Tax=Myroides marinus TaxID=703342 RepID=A0A161SCJ1_9FLAO|nr:DoxX family protein [Myroides marinus]MDR0195862.1 DoxX family protein [Myroides sp.]KUF43206.1 DoxX family protein [Myroides marinus]KZE78125.1 DoxX family protein [Myroides marinus]MDM1348708.1 DoxX family protein [Myroides marinus]MDM1350073.1 DoxX family protein [Myroides marinus]
MNADFGKFLLRLGVGGLMIFHGIHKLIHGHDFIINQLKAHNLPELLWIGVPIGEIIAPIFLIVGFATRISASIVAFTMFMSLFLVKGMGSFGLDPNTGGVLAELNLLYLLSALAIAFIGPGTIRFYKGKKGIWV